MNRIHLSSSTTPVADAAPTRDASANHSSPDTPSSRARPDKNQGPLGTLSYRAPVSRSTGTALLSDAFLPAAIAPDAAKTPGAVSNQSHHAYDIDDLTKQLSMLASLAGRRIAKIGIRAALAFAEAERHEERKISFTDRGSDEVFDGLKRGIPTKLAK